MQLFYDKSDFPYAKKLKDDRLKWLQELGAIELSQAQANADGFLFGYHHGTEHHARQVRDFPNLRDRPPERAELLRLDEVLRKLEEAGVTVPQPKTWTLAIDDPLPADLEFPLFLRTPKSSWKRGGDQAKARNVRELIDEVELLRRAFGWDTPVLARQWIDVAIAGKWMFGNAPQEIRTWVVDGIPRAWSFHYLHAVRNPAGFPPSAKDLAKIADWAKCVAQPFQSRLIAIDFIRDKAGSWYFLEACPGAMAGTAHESVFKFVARCLVGSPDAPPQDPTGGPF